MKFFIVLFLVFVFCILGNCKVLALNLPGPKVYVVTPSSISSKIDEGRSAPFYYHSWMRRMDSGPNITTTTVPTTTKSQVKTPDLIFAEFESDSNGAVKKSIRKLLEKERVEAKSSTTFQPIYVPDKEFQPVHQNTNYGLPLPNVKQEDKDTKQADEFDMYNKFYNNPVPIYVPTTTPFTTTTKLTTTTTTQVTPSNVENIWHIIDSEKYNEYADNWQEVSVGKNDENAIKSDTNEPVDTSSVNEEEKLYDNLALPGFGTNAGSGAENESRAIRTDPNIRFPYVNLKPFQIKTMKTPIQNILSNSKKGNNLFSLDNFYDLKNPVRGEAQDIIPMRQPIDRYNPAQPYLPQQNYGDNSKQSNIVSAPVKTTASLIPPPPPPPPKLTDSDFPIPTSYESFPPYPSSISDSPPPSPPAAKPVLTYSPPSPPIDDSDSDQNSDGSPMGLEYHYESPTDSFKQQLFAPTIPPPNKPFEGYSYKKPAFPSKAPPMVDMDDKPDFHGYPDDKPDNLSPHSNKHHESPKFQHDTDYPELIFNKPPSDDSGFPSDFPGDLKYHHDFDDDDFYHDHHYHKPTTTTTTTEMPRVNRFSYYYLGKKLYYLPLYFSVYFIVYVGALIIKAVLRHKIVYPNSWRPNDTTASFFSKRSLDSWDLSNESLHEVTGKVTHAIATAAKMYMDNTKKNN
ncbi:unnamed protein product [Parnassius apollo]|uniref:(apollo) hypothetical protein n=1 Tax=Parnassius apollo TaxID=110799 RepID=A0A8S3WSC5_PARAO|nr:unnamed protein product [Parnassius apollo]